MGSGKLETKIALWVTILLFLLPAYAWTQTGDEPVVAVWETDAPPEGGWTVGDVIPMRLRVTYPAGLSLTLPELPEKWAAFEVREQRVLEPTTDDGATTAVCEARVTLWVPGEHETPPLTVRYRDANDGFHEVAVQPLSISIASVLTEDDLEKRDLKPQASLPRPPLWPWLLGGALAAAVLLVGARWLWQRRRRRTATEMAAIEPVDDRLPEEIAYDELERIASLDLPAHGELKRHYTLVTDCVRTYIEGITQVPAMDRTTSELMAALRRAPIRDAIPVLRSLLEEADLVKFAKLQPSVMSARNAVAQARHLVDVTKPDRAPAVEDDQQPATQPYVST